eukprot:gene7907-7326_t
MHLDGTRYAPMACRPRSPSSSHDGLPSRVSAAVDDGIQAHPGPPPRPTNL